MKTIVRLPRHVRVWAEVLISPLRPAAGGQCASLKTGALDTDGLQGWEATLGVEIPRGAWFMSGEISAVSVAEGTTGFEVSVPESVFTEGLGQNSFGNPVPSPRDFCDAVVAGFARRATDGGALPRGRLVVHRVGPGLGGCTPQVMRGLGWMCADLWGLQGENDLKSWAASAFMLAFPEATARGKDPT